MYISVALLDNCKSYPFRRSQSARKITSERRSTPYTSWMYKGSIAVLRGVGKSAHAEGRGTGDVSESRAYTHRRRENMVANWLRHSSEAVLRVPFEISSFLSFSPCTRVHRHEGGRENRVKATEGKRETEKGGEGDWLYEKNSPLKLSTRKEPPSCRLPLHRSASILRGIIGRYLHLLYAREPHAAHYRRALLNHAWRARPAIYKAART